MIKQDILAIYVTHHRLEAEFVADEIAFIADSRGGGINKIYHSPVKSFIEAPPVLEAIRIFNYPTPNILKCFVNANKQISFPSHYNEGYNFIVTPPSAIKLRLNEGFEFKVISTNPIYSVVEMEGQKITVHTTEGLFEGNMKINFSGNILRYSEEQLLIETLSSN